MNFAAHCCGRVRRMQSITEFNKQLTHNVNVAIDDLPIADTPPWPM